jgi:L-ascorbate metabolism protein UlaG (beta-lactamase superfamily)
MAKPKLRITYIGGPTCVLDFGGVRLLTDPTFDQAGGEYTTGPVTLRKLAGPAVGAEDLGPFDYVLLSHDHHFDNLDNTGRRILANAQRVLTTDEGARGLGGNSLGLKDWQSIDLPTPDGRALRVVATPGRHGPEGLSRGAVTGFALSFADTPEHVIYISGDTVLYQGVLEVGRRFNVQVAILHLGAARVPEVGPFHLTMTAEEALEVARAFANAVLVPVHFEDWAHLSEGRADVDRAFARAQLGHRIRWPERGREIEIGSDIQASSKETKLA